MGARRLKGWGKRAFCLMLIACFPILPGCWDRKELNEIALIRGVGIDRTEDGQIEVTLLQSIPQRLEQAEGGATGMRRQRIISDRGISISEAYTKLQQLLGREIFVGHQEVVVLGRRMAETGIQEVLDYVSKNPAVRKDALMFVSNRSPEEIFEVQPKTEITSSEILYKMAGVGNFEMTAIRVMQEMAGDSKSTIIPSVRKKGDQLTLEGAALFRGDRMVDCLDRGTAETLRWIRNQFSMGTVDTRLKGEKKGYISMRVAQTKTQLIPEVKGDKPSMILKMTAEGLVLNNTTGRNLFHPSSNMKEVNRALEREIRDRLQRAVKRLQRARADAVGFGNAFHQKHPKVWAKMAKDWNERVFPRLEVDYRVTVNLRWPGMRDYMSEIG